MRKLIIAIDDFIEAAIRALGRQQRGIIAIYKEEPDDLLDFDLEQFMQISQQYRQEVI